MRRFLVPTLLASALAMPAGAQPMRDRVVARDSADTEARPGTEDGPRHRDRQRPVNAVNAREIQPPAPLHPRAVAVPRKHGPDQVQAERQQTERQRRAESRSQDREMVRKHEQTSRWRPHVPDQGRQTSTDTARNNPVHEPQGLRTGRRSSPEHWQTTDRHQRRDWNRTDRWDRDWRSDRRYNWQDWRSTHRHLYTMPRYQAPYGYGSHHRRIVMGIQLDRLFYGRAYWISDPWSYRLPAAYGPYRWVRYHDDVLLIDLRDGRVLDVLYDFFW